MRLVYALLISIVIHASIIFLFNGVGEGESVEVVDRGDVITVTFINKPPTPDQSPSKWKPQKGIVNFSDNPENTPDTWYIPEDDEEEKKDEDELCN